MSFAITVLYNNVPGDSRLDPAWGFACTIDRGDYRILFDAGGDGAILMDNIRLLGVDTRGVNSVVLSHGHWDHMGGLWDALRAVCPATVYHPKSQTDLFQAHIAKLGSRAQAVEKLIEIVPGVMVLPEMGEKIKEQVLVLQCERGVSILTGCAHPGIVEIVREVQRTFHQPVDFVFGGFHLKDHKAPEIAAIVSEMKTLGVRRVAPSHCTGEKAIKAFAAAWGDDFLEIGCGARFTID